MHRDLNIPMQVVFIDCRSHCSCYLCTWIPKGDVEIARQDIGLLKLLSGWVVA